MTKFTLLVEVEIEIEEVGHSYMSDVGIHLEPDTSRQLAEMYPGAEILTIDGMDSGSHA